MVFNDDSMVFLERKKKSTSHHTRCLCVKLKVEFGSTKRLMDTYKIDLYYLYTFLIGSET